MVLDHLAQFENLLSRPTVETLLILLACLVQVSLCCQTRLEVFRLFLMRLTRIRYFIKRLACPVLVIFAVDLFHLALTEDLAWLLVQDWDLLLACSFSLRPIIDRLRVISGRFVSQVSQADLLILN